MELRSAKRKQIDGGVQIFFDGVWAKSYFFALSDSFLRQLDIAITTKGATAGSCFAFEAGDVFYDNAVAYSLSWGQAKRQVSCMVRVLDAVDSTIVQEERIDENGVAKKMKFILDGTLEFELVLRGENGELDFAAAKKIQCNQYDFAELLRTGELPLANISLKKS